MNKEALGVIETVGMVAAIQAADTCVKSANVELIGYELTKGSGLIVIKIRGNVGAVKAAIEAAKVSVSTMGKVYATLVIPRPAENLGCLIESDSTVGARVNEDETKTSIEEENNKDVQRIEEDNKDKTRVNIEEDNKDFQIVDEDLEDIKILKGNNKNDDKFEGIDKTLGNNDFVLDNSREFKDFQEERVVGEQGFQEERVVSEQGFQEERVVGEQGFQEKKVADERGFQEEKVIDEKVESEEVIHDDSSLNEKEMDEVCNICHDATCTRKKGQPKTLCINYKGTRR